jgi:cathepsin C
LIHFYKRQAMILYYLSIFVFTVGGVLCDTPANCTYEDIEGIWDFYETARNGDADIVCSKQGHAVERLTVFLTYPNTAKDEFGNLGTWTMVYNQGFEVVVNGRSYFGFSDYKVLPDKKTVESYCDKIPVGSGWSHDITVRNWACLHARKRHNKSLQYKVKVHTRQNIANKGSKPYKHDLEEVILINSMQTSWVASTYQKFEDLTEDDIENMKGGEKSRLYYRPSAKPVQKLLKGSPGGYLPETWDWRNVDGVNYVPKVRNQGSCGSCYAFASRGMLESRINILTKNSRNVSLSPQDIMDCSPLSQGCSGGFPYLIAGRYGKSYGFVDESCNPYRQKDGTCNLEAKKSCDRHYVASYSYVGGSYGACNEEEMNPPRAAAEAAGGGRHQAGGGGLLAPGPGGHLAPGHGGLLAVPRASTDRLDGWPRPVAEPAVSELRPAVQDGGRRHGGGLRGPLGDLARQQSLSGGSARGGGGAELSGELPGCGGRRCSGACKGR